MPIKQFDPKRNPFPSRRSTHLDLSMMRFIRCTFACMAFLTTASASSQNLIVNGDFAYDLSGWTTVDAIPQWSSFDIDGSPTSGTAYYANTQAEPGVRQTVLSQCIPIPEPGTYIFGASAYTLIGQPSTGNLIGGYLVDPHHTDCSGGYTAVGGFFMQSLGAWKSYATTGGIYPPLSIPSLNPGVSVLITFAVEKTEAGGSFGGYFDAGYLVKLIDEVFADGFE